MTQRELNRAVARATGESITTIARMGFSHFDDTLDDHEPLTVDWDDLDANRPGLFPLRPGEPRTRL